MSQSTANYTTVCVHVSGAAAATDIVVLVDGIATTKFTARPCAGGSLRVCVRVEAGQSTLIEVDADGVTTARGVP